MIKHFVQIKWFYTGLLCLARHSYSACFLNLSAVTVVQPYRSSTTLPQPQVLQKEGERGRVSFYNFCLASRLSFRLETTEQGEKPFSKSSYQVRQPKKLQTNVCFDDKLKIKRGNFKIYIFQNRYQKLKKMLLLVCLLCIRSSNFTVNILKLKKKEQP